MAFIRKSKLIEIKTKSSRKEVVLPVITSKMFEIGPLKPLKSDRYLIHGRKKDNFEKSSIPEAYRSLDLRQSE